MVNLELTPSKMPFSQNYSFRLESSGKSVLILLKQQWGESFEDSAAESPGL